MKYLLTILVAVLSFVLVDAQTIYMVRHGEKSTAAGVDLKNPPLSEKGMNRAKDLQKILKNKNIDVIYVTNTLRSNETAAQVAQDKKITPTVYNPMPDLAWIQSLIDAKKDVLIVAHSNTIGHIYNLINEASGKEKSNFEHSEEVYNTFYTFHLKDRNNFLIKMIPYGAENDQ